MAPLRSPPSRSTEKSWPHFRPSAVDRQRLAVRNAKLNDIGAVALRTVDHDAVLAAQRSHAQLRRSFDQSSSASRFTAGAFAFFILSQSGERPEMMQERERRRARASTISGKRRVRSLPGRL